MAGVQRTALFSPQKKNRTRGLGMLQRGLFRSCRPLELSYPDARELAIQCYLDRVY